MQPMRGGKDSSDASLGSSSGYSHFPSCSLLASAEAPGIKREKDSPVGGMGFPVVQW